MSQFDELGAFQSSNPQTLLQGLGNQATADPNVEAIRAARKARTPQEPEPEQDHMTALGRGAANLYDQAAFGLGENPETLARLAERHENRPDEDVAYDQNLAKQFQDVADAEGFLDTLGEVVGAAGHAVADPGQLLRFVSEQAPNVLPGLAAGMAGRMAGAKAGAALGSGLGPVGAVVGGLGGMFAGGAMTNYFAEKAGNVMDAVKDPTDIEQVRKAVADSDTMSEAEHQAFMHSVGVSSVDLLTMMITRGIVSKGGIGAALTGFGVETAGEGAGEAAGLALAGKEVTAADVGMEMLGGAGMSAATTAMAMPFGAAKTPEVRAAQEIARQGKIEEASRELAGRSFSGGTDTGPLRDKGSFKADMSNVPNPVGAARDGGDATFTDATVGESAYNLGKFSRFLGTGGIGNARVEEEINKLVDDFVLNDKASPQARQEARDAIDQVFNANKGRVQNSDFVDDAVYKENSIAMQMKAKYDAQIQEMESKASSQDAEKKAAASTTAKVKERQLKDRGVDTPKPAKTPDEIKSEVKEELVKELNQSGKEQDEKESADRQKFEEAASKKAADQVAKREEVVDEIEQRTAPVTSPTAPAQPEVALPEPAVTEAPAQQASPAVDRMAAIKAAQEKVAAEKQAVLEAPEQPTTPTATTPQALAQEEQTAPESQGKLQRIGTAQGKGYKSKRDVDARRNALNGFAKRWPEVSKEEAKSWLKKDEGAWWIEVPEGRDIGPPAEKAKRKSKASWRERAIPKKVEFTPQVLNKQGKATGAQLLNPVRLKDGRMTTSTFRRGEEGWEVLMEDGAWVDAKKVSSSFGDQNSMLANQAPAPQEGQQLVNLRGATHEELAKKESDEGNRLSKVRSNLNKQERAAADLTQATPESVPVESPVQATETVEEVIDPQPVESPVTSDVEVSPAEAFLDRFPIDEQLEIIRLYDEATINELEGRADNNKELINDIMQPRLGVRLPWDVIEGMSEAMRERMPITPAEPPSVDPEVNAKRPESKQEPIAELPKGVSWKFADSRHELEQQVTGVGHKAAAFGNYAQELNVPGTAAISSRSHIIEPGVSLETRVKRSGGGYEWAAWVSGPETKSKPPVIKPAETIEEPVADSAPVVPPTTQVSQMASASQQDADFARHLADVKVAWIENEDGEYDWVQLVNGNMDPLTNEVLDVADRVPLITMDGTEAKFYDMAMDEDVSLDTLDMDRRIAILEEYTSFATAYQEKFVGDAVVIPVENTPPKSKEYVKEITADDFEAAPGVDDFGEAVENDPYMEDEGPSFEDDVTGMWEDRKLATVSDTPPDSLAVKKAAAARMVSSIRKNAPNGIKIQTYWSEADFPHSNKTAARLKARHPDLAGFYDKGENTVHVFGYQANTAKDIERFIMHEAVGHAGMQGLFGNKWKNFVDRIIDTNRKAMAHAFRDTPKNYGHKSFDLTADEIARVKKSRKALGSDWVIVDDMQGRPIKKVSRKDARMLVNEHVARQSELFIKDPGLLETLEPGAKNWFKRVLAYVKHLLRPFINAPVSDMDIISLLAESHDRALRGENHSAYYKQLDKGSHGRSDFEKTAGEKFQDKDWGGLWAADEPHSWNQATAAKSGVAGSPGYGWTDVNAMQDVLTAPESGVGWLNAMRKGADAMLRKLSRVRYIRNLTHGKGMQHERQYEMLRRISQGRIHLNEQRTKNLATWLSKAPKDTLDKVTDAWLGGQTFDSVPGLNTMQRGALTQARADLETFQKTLNGIEYKGSPLISDEQLENTRGTYLHKEYLQYLGNYRGSGQTPSPLDWMKKQHASKELGARLEEIKNASYLLPSTLGMVGRDTHLLRFMDDVVQNSKSKEDGGAGTHWVLDSSSTFKVDLADGPAQLTINQIRDQLEQTVAALSDEHRDLLRVDQEAVVHLEHNKKQLEEAYAAHKTTRLDNIREAMWKSGYPYATANPHGTYTNPVEISDEEAMAALDQDYVWVTKGKHPALLPFHGKYVHRTIVEDFGNSDWGFESEVGGKGTGMNKLYKDMTSNGGFLDSSTRWWKLSKTGLNVPAYYIRNLVGNMFLLDVSTSTNAASLTAMLGKETLATFRGNGERVGGKTYKEWAEEFGLYATTYGASELYFLADGFESQLKKADSKKNKEFFKLAGYQMKDSMMWVAEKTANMHGLMEGIFKQVAMKDYINRYERLNKGPGGKPRKFNDLTAEEQRGLMAAAAEEAENAIFDYQKVPEWVRRLRRTPLGTPFLTFNYKLAGALPRAMMKHPWKLARYYAAPAAITAMLMELDLADFDEEDFEEAQKKIPWYMKNKSGIVTLPVKDGNGKMQYFDLTYIFPPTLFTDSAMKLMNPEPGANRAGAFKDIVFGDIGLLGGPVPQAIAAGLSNKDPFTGRDIWQDGDTQENNWERLGTWLYSMWMPPVLTQSGALGRSFDQAGIDLPILSSGRELTKYGTDRETVNQTIARAFGLSGGGISGREAVIGNEKRFQFKLNQIQKLRSQVAKDTNLSSAERAKAIREYNELIVQLSKHHRSS